MRSILGISMGDPAGIGAEIIVKALQKVAVYENAIPVVIGDRAALEDAIGFTGSLVRIREVENPEEAKGEAGIIDLINCGFLQPRSWEYKKVSKETGYAAYQYVERAVRLAIDRRTAAVVTAPINKEAINLAGYHYAGHTEILAHLTGTEDFAMLLASRDLLVIHVTTHVSMEDACRLITKERVYNVIRLARQGMLELGFQNPRIGVAGFNPHSSENGLFGTQEAEAIIPAIKKAQEEGIRADGPLMPDTAFVKALGGQYDIVVAMYHDQGHIPLKLTGFKLDPVTSQYTAMSGINCTIGLPIVRTSVDHGTAFGKAGEGRANEESMSEAIMAAVKMAGYRARHRAGGSK
jgi:4-hydroxythreonine-4-phosphate dehydrogenase